MEVRDVPRSLVDAHQRRERAATAGREAFALFGRGAVGQFGEGEDEQQTLRFGLCGGGGQKPPEMRVVVHPLQGRTSGSLLSYARRDSLGQATCVALSSGR